MGATPTPAPPQTLKVTDQYGNRIGLNGYQDGSLQINNLDFLGIFVQILDELKLIRKHLELLTEENIQEVELEEISCI